MRPREPKRLKALKAWLAIASAEDKSAIRAMIAKLEGDDSRIGTAAQEPGRPTSGSGGMGRGADVDALPGTATSEKVQTREMAARPGSSSGSGQIAAAAASAIPPVLSNPDPLAGLPEAVHWRQARQVLRVLGHEVHQVDGVLFLDGKRCDDPRLRP